MARQRGKERQQVRAEMARIAATREEMIQRKRPPVPGQPAGVPVAGPLPSAHIPPQADLRPPSRTAPIPDPTLTRPVSPTIPQVQIAHQRAQQVQTHQTPMPHDARVPPTPVPDVPMLPDRKPRTQKEYPSHYLHNELPTPPPIANAPRPAAMHSRETEFLEATGHTGSPIQKARNSLLNIHEERAAHAAAEVIRDLAPPIPPKALRPFWKDWRAYAIALPVMAFAALGGAVADEDRKRRIEAINEQRAHNLGSRAYNRIHGLTSGMSPQLQAFTADQMKIPVSQMGGARPPMEAAAWFMKVFGREAERATGLLLGKPGTVSAIEPRLLSIFMRDIKRTEPLIEYGEPMHGAFKTAVKVQLAGHDPFMLKLSKEPMHTDLQSLFASRKSPVSPRTFFASPNLQVLTEEFIEGQTLSDLYKERPWLFFEGVEHPGEGITHLSGAPALDPKATVLTPYGKDITAEALRSVGQLGRDTGVWIEDPIPGNLIRTRTSPKWRVVDVGFTGEVLGAPGGSIRGVGTRISWAEYVENTAAGYGEITKAIRVTPGEHFRTVFEVRRDWLGRVREALTVGQTPVLSEAETARVMGRYRGLADAPISTASLDVMSARHWEEQIAESYQYAHQYNVRHSQGYTPSMSRGVSPQTQATIERAAGMAPGGFGGATGPLRMLEKIGKTLGKITGKTAASVVKKGEMFIEGLDRPATVFDLAEHWKRVDEEALKAAEATPKGQAIREFKTAVNTPAATTPEVIEKIQKAGGAGFFASSRSSEAVVENLLSEAKGVRTAIEATGVRTSASAHYISGTAVSIRSGYAARDMDKWANAMEGGGGAHVTDIAVLFQDPSLKAGAYMENVVIKEDPAANVFLKRVEKDPGTWMGRPATRRTAESVEREYAYIEELRDPRKQIGRVGAPGPAYTTNQGAVQYNIELNVFHAEEELTRQAAEIPEHLPRIPVTYSYVETGWRAEYFRRGIARGVPIEELEAQAARIVEYEPYMTKQSPRIADITHEGYTSDLLPTSAKGEAFSKEIDVVTQWRTEETEKIRQILVDAIEEHKGDPSVFVEEFLKRPSITDDYIESVQRLQHELQASGADIAPDFMQTMRVEQGVSGAAFKSREDVIKDMLTSQNYFITKKDPPLLDSLNKAIQEGPVGSAKERMAKEINQQAESMAKHPLEQNPIDPFVHTTYGSGGLIDSAIIKKTVPTHIPTDVAEIHAAIIGTTHELGTAPVKKLFGLAEAQAKGLATLAKQGDKTLSKAEVLSEAILSKLNISTLEHEMKLPPGTLRNVPFVPPEIVRSLTTGIRQGLGMPSAEKAITKIALSDALKVGIYNRGLLSPKAWEEAAVKGITIHPKGNTILQNVATRAGAPTLRGYPGDAEGKMYSMMLRLDRGNAEQRTLFAIDANAKSSATPRLATPMPARPVTRTGVTPSTATTLSMRRGRGLDDMAEDAIAIGDATGKETRTDLYDYLREPQYTPSLAITAPRTPMKVPAPRPVPYAHAMRLEDMMGRPSPLYDMAIAPPGPPSVPMQQVRRAHQDTAALHLPVEPGHAFELKVPVHPERGIERVHLPVGLKYEPIRMSTAPGGWATGPEHVLDGRRSAMLQGLAEIPSPNKGMETRFGAMNDAGHQLARTPVSTTLAKQSATAELAAPFTEMEEALRQERGSRMMMSKGQMRPSTGSMRGHDKFAVEAIDTMRGRSFGTGTFPDWAYDVRESGQRETTRAHTMTGGAWSNVRTGGPPAPTLRMSDGIADALTAEGLPEALAGSATPGTMADLDLVSTSIPLDRSAGSEHAGGIVRATAGIKQFDGSIIRQAPPNVAEDSLRLARRAETITAQQTERAGTEYAEHIKMATDRGVEGDFISESARQIGEQGLTEDVYMHEQPRFQHTARVEPLKQVMPPRTPPRTVIIQDGVQRSPAVSYFNNQWRTGSYDPGKITESLRDLHGITTRDARHIFGYEYAGVHGTVGRSG